MILVYLKCELILALYNFSYYWTFSIAPCKDIALHLLRFICDISKGIALPTIEIAIVIPFSKS